MVNVCDRPPAYYGHKGRDTIHTSGGPRSLVATVARGTKAVAKKKLTLTVHPLVAARAVSALSALVLAILFELTKAAWPLRTQSASRAADPHLDGLAVVVTGGSNGIGRAIAMLAAAKGARVAVIDARQTPLEGSAAPSISPDIVHIRADVSNRADVARSVGRTQPYLVPALDDDTALMFSLSLLCVRHELLRKLTCGLRAPLVLLGSGNHAEAAQCEEPFPAFGAVGNIDESVHGLLL